ncbi:uncharacterized protein LOC129763619 [Toxorhynchites rutilus septentrionalis]|uniref:uncharacterized protein LOC129763619 n=1 Tax=Toxorhynchites rutilus septentrionalis TaxID=329112 RepID=UPI00247AA12F|nr:uncharacterized protein LOC129763619 [Toxorhynchites rutilus septentrionalis]
MVDFIPLRRSSPKPPWGNAHLRRLKRLRSKALRDYCQSRCVFTKHCFAWASNSYRTFNRYLYKRYCIRTQEDLRRHPRNFWKFVNSKRKDNNGLPAEFLGSEVANYTATKCNLFATHFRSAFNDSTLSGCRIIDACRDTPRDVCHLRNLAVSPDQVKFAINKLKCSMSSPDGIPSFILKKCGEELIRPLTTLFNLSLRQRCFPTCWKTSIMFPVFKKGDRQNIENYRGITSLCACSKVFEILLNDLLFDSCKNYIATDQHGFYPKRSTTTNLAQFASFCISNIDAGAQVDTVYTDLKTAFDRVDHGILLERLGRIGVSADLVSWFESYLTNRMFTVNIGSDNNSYNSCWIVSPKGVHGTC